MINSALKFGFFIIPNPGEVIQNLSETAESIKQKYESNPDTNAFTDDDKEKLEGIEDYLESTFQKKHIIRSNVPASLWLVDDTYPEFGYKCTIDIPQVNENDIVEVIFSHEDALSGNYSPICVSDYEKVHLYSKVNTPITIPTIIINKMV